MGRVVKPITFAYNTSVHEITGRTPFELTFGKTANIPSAIGNTPGVTYDILITKWRKRHDYLIQKAQERIEESKKRNKEWHDSRRVRTHPIYRQGNKVLIKDHMARGKLTSTWKGPYQVEVFHENYNNVTVNINGRLQRIHTDNIRPYFSVTDATNFDSADEPTSATSRNSDRTTE